MLLAPVLHPPSVRLFESQTSFSFANPAAVVGPGSLVIGPTPELDVLPRLAAVIGSNGAVGGYTPFAEWRARSLEPPKDRDFALGLGPVVVTPDEVSLPTGFDWDAAVALLPGTPSSYPGDVLPARRQSRAWSRTGTSRSISRESAPSRSAWWADVQLVLDWDGTITEADTLHVAIEEFGDMVSSSRWRVRSAVA